MSVLLTVYMGWMSLSVKLNADFSTYLSQDDPLVQDYNQIGDIFGGNDIGIVLVSSQNLFEEEKLELVKRLTDRYDQMDGINYVTSLTNVVDFRKTEWGLEVGKLFNSGNVPNDPVELQELKNYILQKERLRGNLLTADGTTTAIILRFEGGDEPDINQYITALNVKAETDRVLEEFGLPEGTTIYYGGLPFLIFNMTLLIMENLTVLVPLILVLLLGVLYLGFRHWAGVVFPLIVVSVSTLWVTGIMGIIGLQFDLLTGIMPVVLLALGSADGIHLMKRFYERRNQGDRPEIAAKYTFKEMGTPIILTTLTTTVGFTSLAISNFSVIVQFGLLSALGVIIALLITLTLLPALLSFGVRYTRDEREKAMKTPYLDGFSTWVYRNKGKVVAVSVITAIVALVAIPKIEKDVDWSLCLAKGSDPYHAEMLLREKFGGSLPVQIVVDGDMKDPAVLDLMQYIARYVETVPKIGQPQSMASIVAEMNKVLNDHETVPEQRQGVTNLWFLVEGEAEMDQVVARESQKGLIQAKLATWHTGTLVASVDSINTFLQNLPKTLWVVQLDKIDPNAREPILNYRAGQIRKELGWVFAKYNIPADNQLLEQLTSTVMNFQIDAKVQKQIMDELETYLSSDEAELPLKLNQRLAVAEAIANEPGTTNTLSQSRTAELIMNNVDALSIDDAEWFSASLSAIAEMELGNARVEPALEKVRSDLRNNGLWNDQLYNDLKAVFWTANKDYVLIDEASAPRLLAANDEAILRSVPVSLRQSGMPQVLKSMEEELVPTQIESLLIALLFVVVLLAVIFRSTLVALLAIVPISLTILINFAVMGYLGIGLDSFTAMIASIAIGLGIDTDIHMISRFREELAKTGDKLEAMKQTVRTTGMSVMINALAVGLGFIVLLAAGGQHIRRFGGLTALTVLVSALLSLTLLAVLLMWLKPKYLQLQKQEPKLLEAEEIE